MKKFLVILMVVAMASVLFVGCTTPPTPEPEPEPEPTPTPIVSATPVLTDVQTSLGVSIFDVTSTATLYMNIAEVGASILVTGTAPSESLVKIYLGDVAVGPAVAEASTAGLWTVAIAKSSLGDDGVKVLTAKVTEVGLAESAASNAVTFTLDTVRPSATTLAATAESSVGATGGTSLITAGGTAVLTAIATPADVVTGTWVINVLGISGAANNVTFSLNGGTATTYTAVPGSEVFGAGAPIPGVVVTLAALLSPGQVSTITCLARNTPIAGRATVLYSEDVTVATADLGVFTGIDFTTGAAHATPVAETYLAYVGNTSYYTLTSTPDLALYDTVRVTVNGTIDLAGNTQTTASSLSCTVGAASLTTLAP